MHSEIEQMGIPAIQFFVWLSNKLKILENIGFFSEGVVNYIHAQKYCIKRKGERDEKIEKSTYDDTFCSDIS